MELLAAVQNRVDETDEDGSVETVTLRRWSSIVHLIIRLGAVGTGQCDRLCLWYGCDHDYVLALNL